MLFVVLLRLLLLVAAIGWLLFNNKCSCFELAVAMVITTCHHCGRTLSLQRGSQWLLCLRLHGISAWDCCCGCHCHHRGWIFLHTHCPGYGRSYRKFPPLSCNTAIAIEPAFPCPQFVSFLVCCCHCVTNSKVDCSKNMLIGVVVATCRHCAAICWCWFCVNMLWRRILPGVLLPPWLLYLLENAHVAGWLWPSCPCATTLLPWSLLCPAFDGCTLSKFCNCHHYGWWQLPSVLELP